MRIRRLTDDEKIDKVRADNPTWQMTDKVAIALSPEFVCESGDRRGYGDSWDTALRNVPGTAEVK